MTFNFRAELDSLATLIAQHPLTEVLAYEVGEPASPILIREVESKFGKEIPKSVVDLYGLLNGATLRWRFRSDLEEFQRNRIMEEFGSGTAVFATAGAIELVPLEDALLHEDYTLLQMEEQSDDIVFDNTTYTDNEFSGLLRIFDAVSDDTAMAFVTQPDTADWKLMWLQNSWAEYDASRVTWLNDYLRIVIATWGLFTARDSLFLEWRGYEDEPVTFDEGWAAALLPNVLSIP
jgi:hypothetical protein